MDDTKWLSPIIRQRLSLALFLSLLLLVYLKLRAEPLNYSSLSTLSSNDFMTCSQLSEVIDLNFTN